MGEKKGVKMGKERQTPSGGLLQARPSAPSHLTLGSIFQNKTSVKELCEKGTDCNHFPLHFLLVLPLPSLFLLSFPIALISFNTLIFTHDHVQSLKVLI